MTDDAIAAALLQLSEHAERLAVLDEREAGHFRATGERLSELANLITGLGGTLQDQAATLARLESLCEQVTSMAAQADGILPDADGDPRCYRPAPAPRWWKLDGEARAEAVARVRAWVEQVYRPGYGQLAATLGPCWEQHPLCLYGLDVLSELWSVLYLQASRSPAMLSAQAEYQARIVPAIAEQLMTETTRCGHATTRRPANGAPEPAMTGSPAGETALARALAYARHGWPVFPCQPGRKEPDTPHGFKDATTDPGPHHRLVDRGARPERGDRHRRPRARRARRGRAARRQRVPAPTAGSSALGCSKAPSPSSRHPAAGCTPTTPVPARPAGGCPAATWTSRPPAGTSSPRPRPSAASPTGWSGTSRTTRRRAGGWTGPPPSPCWTRRSESRKPRGRPAMPMPPGWPPGSPSCPKATGTQACSGPPAAPPKPGTPKHSTRWPKRRRPPGCPSRRSSGPSPPHGAAPGTGSRPARDRSTAPNPNPNMSPRR